MIFPSVKTLLNFTKQHATITFYVNCIRISVLNKGYSLSITVIFKRKYANNMIRLSLVLFITHANMII